jgi:hypothetical protein
MQADLDECVAQSTERLNAFPVEKRPTAHARPPTLHVARSSKQAFGEKPGAAVEPADMTWAKNQMVRRLNQPT